MTSAIIIIISILFISIALFFVIKRISSVSKDNIEEYEEGSLTEYDNILNISNSLNSSDSLVNNNSKENTENTIFNNLKLFMANLYKKIRSQIFVNIEKYKENQRNKQIKKEKMVRETLSKDEVNLNLIQVKEEDNIDLDKEFLEESNKIRTFNIPTNNKSEREIKGSNNTQEEINIIEEPISSESIRSINKADSFVEQLLEEDNYSYEDINTKVVVDQDVNDNYYYQYMEKRYIDKIVKNPKDITAYRKLGDLYFDIKNYQDAIESYKMVVKLKPEDSDAKIKLNKINKILT